MIEACYSYVAYHKCAQRTPAHFPVAKQAVKTELKDEQFVAQATLNFRQQRKRSFSEEDADHFPRAKVQVKHTPDSAALAELGDSTTGAQPLRIPPPPPGKKAYIPGGLTAAGGSGAAPLVSHSAVAAAEEGQSQSVDTLTAGTGGGFVARMENVKEEEQTDSSVLAATSAAAASPPRSHSAAATQEVSPRVAGLEAAAHAGQPPRRAAAPWGAAAAAAAGIPASGGTTAPSPSRPRRPRDPVPPRRLSQRRSNAGQSAAGAASNAQALRRESLAPDALQEGIMIGLREGLEQGKPRRVLCDKCLQFRLANPEPLPPRRPAGSCARCAWRERTTEEPLFGEILPVLLAYADVE